MPHIVVIASQKGGAGKTTLATSLADALALAGERVLIADADPQRSALIWGEQAPPDRAVPVIGAGAALLSPRQIQPLAAAYQWLLIDCPPRMGDTTNAAIAVADLVLVPVRPTPMDLAVLPTTLAVLEGSGKLSRAVITQRPPRSAAADSAPEAIRVAGLEVLTAEIGFRADYADAYSHGAGVCRYAPKSRAAAEVLAVLAEVRALLSPTTAPKKQRGRK